MSVPGSSRRFVSLRLSPAAQAVFDRSAFTSANATAKALGITASTVDALAFGGQGRSEVVARVEELIAQGALSR